MSLASQTGVRLHKKLRILELVRRTRALDKLDAFKLVIPDLCFWKQHLAGGDTEGHDVCGHLAVHFLRLECHYHFLFGPRDELEAGEAVSGQLLSDLLHLGEWV